MAKRITPFHSAQTSKDKTIEKTTIISNAENINKNDQSQNGSFSQILSKDIVEKLDQYNELVKQNTYLINENSKLTDKLADYISEISKLKSQLSTNLNITPNISISDDCLQKQITNLTTENNTLKLENQQYQDKISQLTFEIASLNSTINILTDDREQLNVNINAQHQPVQTNSNIRNTFQPEYSTFSDKYSSWN